jgi:hypothetical protein
VLEVPDVMAHITKLPTATFPTPELATKAQCPTAVLLLTATALLMAEEPMAMLQLPVSKQPAVKPNAVLSVPVVTLLALLKPTAVLRRPVAKPSAPHPRAVKVASVHPSTLP